MSTEQTIETPSQPLNQLFKQYREEQSLSLETVSGMLNLSIPQLEALESDHLDLSSLTPFERGYIRNYANLLGISGTEFEQYFPKGDKVMSELHNVQRYYTFQNKKPIFGRTIARTLMMLLAVAFVSGVLYLVWPDSQKTDAPGQSTTTIAPPQYTQPPANPQ